MKDFDRNLNIWLRVLLIICFVANFVGCDKNMSFESDNSSVLSVPFLSNESYVEQPSSLNSHIQVSSYTKRSVRLSTKNSTTIKVGDVVSINATHSPTNMTGVKVDYFISNDSVAHFVYDEHNKDYKKYPSGCLIEATAIGEFCVTVSVNAKDGNCSDSINITVVE